MASKEEFEVEAAMHESQAAINRNMWAVTLGLKPFRDGNQWCLLWGANIQEGVCAFGDSPWQAVQNFESAMYECAKEPK